MRMKLAIPPRKRELKNFAATSSGTMLIASRIDFSANAVSVAWIT
jgi:hypothetical protein